MRVYHQADCLYNPYVIVNLVGTLATYSLFYSVGPPSFLTWYIMILIPFFAFLSCLELSKQSSEFCKPLNFWEHLFRSLSTPYPLFKNFSSLWLSYCYSTLWLEWHFFQGLENIAVYKTLTAILPLEDTVDLQPTNALLIQPVKWVNNFNLNQLLKINSI